MISVLARERATTGVASMVGVSGHGGTTAPLVLISLSTRHPVQTPVIRGVAATTGATQVIAGITARHSIHREASAMRVLLLLAVVTLL